MSDPSTILCARSENDARHAVQIEEARAMAQRFTAVDSQAIRKVDLSLLSWNVEALKEIEASLEAVADDVTILEVSDIIAGQLTEVGLAVLEGLVFVFGISSLQELYLADNALGIRGWRRLRILLRQSLKNLDLANCGMDEHSMEGLYRSVVSQGISLHYLKLDKNMIGIEGARHVGRVLARSPQMQQFSYAGCRPETEGTTYICQGLLNMVQQDSNSSSPLLHLDLSDCHFEDQSAKILAQFLEHCPKLQLLNLNDGQLEPEGLKALVDALLKVRPPLEHLDLGNPGEPGDDTTQLLLPLFTALAPTLRVLNLESCELGDDGLTELLNALDQSPLESLNLNLNDITNDGAKALCESNLQLTQLLLEDNEEIEEDWKQQLLNKFGTALVMDGLEDIAAPDDLADQLNNLRV